MVELPDLVLELIFFHLPPECYDAASLVCRRWHDALPRSLVVTPFMLKALGISSLGERYPRLNDVTIYESNKRMLLSRKRIPQLGGARPASLCVRLHPVRKAPGGFPLELFDALDCSALTALDLRDSARAVTDAVVILACAKCPALRSADLDGCYQVGPPGLRAVLAAPNVRYLSAEGTTFGRDDPVPEDSICVSGVRALFLGWRRPDETKKFLPFLRCPELRQFGIRFFGYREGEESDAAALVRYFVAGSPLLSFIDTGGWTAPESVVAVFGAPPALRVAAIDGLPPAQTGTLLRAARGLLEAYFSGVSAGAVWDSPDYGSAWADANSETKFFMLDEEAMQPGLLFTPGTGAPLVLATDGVFYSALDRHRDAFRDRPRRGALRAMQELCEKKALRERMKKKKKRKPARR